MTEWSHILVFCGPLSGIAIIRDMRIDSCTTRKLHFVINNAHFALLNVDVAIDIDDIYFFIMLCNVQLSSDRSANNIYTLSAI